MFINLSTYSPQPVYKVPSEALPTSQIANAILYTLETTYKDLKNENEKGAITPDKDIVISTKPHHTLHTHQ